jgi:hypothetical protein
MPNLVPQQSSSSCIDKRKALRSLKLCIFQPKQCHSYNTR